MIFKRNYLSEKALINLQNYKYVSGESSILDNVLNPFWIKVCYMMPMWLAPNSITLIGLLAMISQMFFYLPFDMTMSKDFSPWCYALSAFSVVFY